MPFGIRPSNVRVCHFTTRALMGVESYGGMPQEQERKADLNALFW